MPKQKLSIRKAREICPIVENAYKRDIINLGSGKSQRQMCIEYHKVK